MQEEEAAQRHRERGVEERVQVRDGVEEQVHQHEGGGGGDLGPRPGSPPLGRSFNLVRIPRR